LRAKLPDYDYLGRCKKLNLETLEYRRLIFDLIHVYKILHNYTLLDVRDYFAFYDTRSRGYANFALKPGVATFEDERLRMRHLRMLLEDGHLRRGLLRTGI
jgi:hypothetical protein